MWLRWSAISAESLAADGEVLLRARSSHPDSNSRNNALLTLPTIRCVSLGSVFRL